MPARRETSFVTSGDARICVESIGDPAHPTILLSAGAGSSMDWWDDDLCERIATGRRRVVRYDNRDTGRSTTYGVGSPGYTGADMVGDMVAILDALEVPAAHVAGLSMGGAFAQLLALEHRDRVRSLTLIATTPVIGGADLPVVTAGDSSEQGAWPSEPDWTDRGAAVDYLVECERLLAGPGGFDEERTRATAARVYDRSDDLPCFANHFELGEDDPGAHTLSELEGVPTLVLHGTDDGMFPGHGRALADAIPGAHLIELEGVGHEYPPPPTWDLVVGSLLRHTEDQ